MTLLSPETPVVIPPLLARKLGSDYKAGILQQLHFWLEGTQGKIIDGVKWFWAAVKKHWKTRFPNWSDRRIRTTLEELVEDGYISREQKSKSTCYHAYWYTINYDKLQPVLDEIASEVANSAKPPSNKRSRRCDRSGNVDAIASDRIISNTSLHKNPSNNFPPTPQGEEGEVKIQNSKTKNEEPASNSTTPSNEEPESMQQPENLNSDNFSGHSPEKEKLTTKTDKYFPASSWRQKQQEMALEALDFPHKLGLSPEDLRRFENEYLDWAAAHPEAGIQSPKGCLTGNIKKAAGGSIFPELDYWKEHGTLKTYLGRIPHEWEEAYETESGWLKIRVKEPFKNWLLDSANGKVGGTIQEATEKVARQLRDYGQTAMQWEQFKRHAVNVQYRVSEQQKLGASGLGEIPGYFQQRQEISLEAYNQVEQQLTAQTQSLLPPSKIGEFSYFGDSPKPTLAEADFQKKKAEAKTLAMQAQLPESQEWTLASLKKAIAGSSQFQRNRAIAFIESSGDYELVKGRFGKIIGVIEVEF